MAETSIGLMPINIARVCESLLSLANDIEFIATGKADNRSDYEAHGRRCSAGRQLSRLRAALNNGDLDCADCDLKTLRVLRNAWSEVEMLRYGSHSDEPDSYRGHLYLPGEISPLEDELRLRLADERYDRFEEWRPKSCSGGSTEASSSLEQEAHENGLSNYETELSPS